MNALRVHGGEATSRRISVRVGGWVPMTDRGEDGEEANTPLLRLESGTSNNVKSSNADEGLGEGSWVSGLRNNCGDDCLELGITISLGVL